MTIKVFKGVEGEGNTPAERMASYFRNLKEAPMQFEEKRHEQEMRKNTSLKARMVMLALAIQFDQDKEKEKMGLINRFGIMFHDVKETFNDLFNDLFDEMEQKSEIERHKQIKKEVEELKKRTDVDYKTVIEKIGISPDNESFKNIGLFEHTASLALQDGIIDKNEMAKLLKIYLTLNNEEVLALKTCNSPHSLVMIEELDSNERIRAKREEHLKLESDNKLNERPRIRNRPSH